MPKLYKFKQLSKKAQDVAVKSYLDGWEENHDVGNMTWGEARSSCIDINDEVLYNKDGTDAEEEE